MQMSLRLSYLILIAILAASSGTHAQAKRPMTIIDRLDVPSVRDPQLSPDGRQLLYLLTGPVDWKSNGRSTHIWQVPVGGGAPVQLTNGPSGESEPRWSPDGQWIAFIARRGDSPQVHIMRSDGQEATAVTQRPTSAPHPDTSSGRLSSLSWSPDGSSLFFLALEPESAAEESRERAADDAYAFDENYKQRHLWRMSVKDRAEERITSGDFSVLEYQLSRDGRKIVFHRAPTPLNGDVDKGEVWVMDADGKRPVQLTRNDWPEMGAQLSPDDTQVLFRSLADERFTSLRTAGLLQGQHVRGASDRWAAAHAGARFRH